MHIFHDFEVDWNILQLPNEFRKTVSQINLKLPHIDISGAVESEGFKRFEMHSLLQMIVQNLSVVGNQAGDLR